MRSGTEPPLLERLAVLTGALGTANDLTAVFRSLRQFIIASVPCNGIFVSLYDPERRERTCVYAFSEGREIETPTLPPLPMNDSPHSRAIATGEVVVTDDLQAALAGRPRVDAGLDTGPRLPQSSIAVPMAVAGRVIGGLEAQSVERAAYDDDHATMMRMAANLAATAIDNLLRIERERAVSRAAQASEQRYRALVSTISHMVWTADAQGRIIADVPAWRTLTGQTADEFRGWGWLNAVHPDDRARAGRAWSRAIRQNSLYEAEYRVRTRNGSYRHFANRGTPVYDADGRIHEWFGVCIDISEQKRNEELQHFLAESSRHLSNSLDYPSTLEEVAKLAVPLLADTCIVYVLEEDGQVRRVGVAHDDPAKAGLLDEIRQRYPIQRHRQHPVLDVLRTGQPELLPDISDAHLESVACDARQLEIFRALGPKSLMTVPLIARGRTLGAITFVIEHSDRRYGPQQLVRTEELASRAALAVDNARLYQAEQEARRRAERAADRIARLQAITAAFSEALTPAEVAGVVVDHGVAALDAAAGFVARLTNDGQTLETLRSIGYPQTVLHPYQLIPLSTPVPIADAVHSREPIWLASTKERDLRYPHLASTTEDLGRCAWASIPMVVEGRCVGAWGLSFTEPREPSDEEIGFMLALGRQCGQALERARLYEESQDANRAKADFLAVMSHELRTPLSAIIGYADLIADEIAGPVVETQKTQLGRIKASSWHLLQLIEQILTFARMEAGHAEVRFEREDVRAIAREAAEMLEAGFAMKDVALHLHLPPEPVQIDTDAGKLRQIFLNLLSNAMKFTDRGEVRLTMAVDDGDLVFTVEDTGIGIAPEYLERIWEPFRQVEDAMTRKVGGTGLGLSVTQRLAQLLGGDVNVASTPGEGSTFAVRLPIRGRADASVA